MITNLRLHSCSVYSVFRICSRVHNTVSKQSTKIKHKNRKSFFFNQVKMFVVLFVHSFVLFANLSPAHDFSKVAWMIRGKENQTHASNKRQKQYRYKFYSSHDWGRKDILAKKTNAGHKSNCFLHSVFKHVKIKIQTIKPFKKKTHTHEERKEKNETVNLSGKASKATIKSHRTLLMKLRCFHSRRTCSCQLLFGIVKEWYVPPLLKI